MDAFVQIQAIVVKQIQAERRAEAASDRAIAQTRRTDRDRRRRQQAVPAATG